MQYLLDTVAVIRFFSSSGKIGNKARMILNNCIKSSAHFNISVISLMEILYLSEKMRIKLSLSKTIDIISNSSLYSIVNLSPEILIIAENIDFYELHDRMILATAKWLKDLMRLKVLIESGIRVIKLSVISYQLLKKYYQI